MWLSCDGRKESEMQGSGGDVDFSGGVTGAARVSGDGGLLASSAQCLVVAGGGYVGLATAVGFASKGHSVNVIEIDAQRAATLNRGELPFAEDSILEPFRQGLESGLLRIYTHYSDLPAAADFAFICTPTPTREDGELDDASVFAAAGSLLGSLDHPVRLVVRSTVSPGTAERLESWARQTHSGTEVLFNPEFLREGRALHDFNAPTRVVVGGGSPSVVAKLLQLYSFSDAPRVLTNLKTAELIKLAVNSALAVRVSLANEIAHVAHAADADVEAVLDGVRADPRIGKDYLSPGIGFGGSCLPKDLTAFRAAANRYSVGTPVFDGAWRTNEVAIERLLHRVAPLKSASARPRVCVIGVAFKPGSDSVRDSQAVLLVRALLRDDVAVTIYDPQAERMARAVLGDTVSFQSSLVDALSESDIAFVLNSALLSNHNDLHVKSIRVLDALGQDFRCSCGS
jgi:UDPglucose 6-dehydrogenase